MGCFLGMGVNFFLERGSGSGLCPDGRGVADGCGFFWIWGGAGLVVRMGAERRFASLLRIAAPSVER